jgi:hypothetical protein
MKSKRLFSVSRYEAEGLRGVKHDRYDTRSGNYELPVGSAGVRKHQEDRTTIGSNQLDRRRGAKSNELEFNNGATE